MKRRFLQPLIGALVLATFCLIANDPWARLPKPIQLHGTLVFVDHETRTVVFKPRQPTKQPKPFVLDWNRDTQFIKKGQAVAATELNRGIPSMISYKHMSFHNPILMRIVWDDRSNAGILHHRTVGSQRAVLPAGCSIPHSLRLISPNSEGQSTMQNARL